MCIKISTEMKTKGIAFQIQFNDFKHLSKIDDILTKCSTRKETKMFKNGHNMSLTN